MAVDDSCSNGTDEKADIADIGTADAVVSLGPNCLPAYHIAKAGFKRRSFPFDVLMTGSDGWSAEESSIRLAPVGLQLVLECLERNPPFSDYVSTMTPLPSINAVGNAGFTDPEFIPSAHIHDDPREPEVAAKYQRRADRFLTLLESGYRVLFIYTMRLRELKDPKHFINVAHRLPLQVAKLRELLARRWPSSLNHLLVVVLGELPPVPPAQRALEACLSRLRSVNQSKDPWVMVRRIPDLPKVPGDPMAGFWGDDKAWTDLFSEFVIKPKDFSEACFQETTVLGSKSADDKSGFEKFVDSLKMIHPA